ncbi:MAG: hypothetical protein J7M19_04130, partial [Planctomycetes bacterium]|nr:hypothetical protein [Planctomycetota bacterium]
PHVVRLSEMKAWLESARRLAGVREASCAFKSIFHLAETVDVRQVNKTVLEVLVKAGAMDSFDARRSQMAAVVSDALEAGGHMQADRRAGQSTFFGGLDDFEEKAAESALPDVPEWSESVLAQNEKQALGYYLSRHPLARYEDVLKRYATATVRDLQGLSDGETVVLGGTISAVKPTVTKTGRSKGEPMARFTLEDLTGSVSMVIFPPQYRESRDLVENDREVLVRGRVDLSRNLPDVKVSDVTPLERADEKMAKRVVVSLSAAAAGADVLEGIADVLKKHPGQLPVFFRLDTPTAKVLLAAGSAYRVDASQELVRECDGLLGAGHIRFAGGNGGR